MNNFIRRLKYYGIGFGIGAVLVMFILPNRSCSWTPSNRVKNMILERFLTINDVEWQLMQTKKLTKDEIRSVLNDGIIDFRASKKEGDTKVYAIDKKISGKGTFRFYFTLPKESFISEVKIGETNAGQVQNTKSGYGRFLSFPHDEYLVYPDSTAKINCQMKQLKIKDTKKIYADIKKNGRLNFAKTQFEAHPKPIHQIDYICDQDSIALRAIWYKNKVFVSDFISATTNHCQ